MIHGAYCCVESEQKLVNKKAGLSYHCGGDKVACLLSDDLQHGQTLCLTTCHLQNVENLPQVHCAIDFPRVPSHLKAELGLQK